MYNYIGDVMLIIGSHVSFNKNRQMIESVEEALSYNANCMMIYLGAPQNTFRKKDKRKKKINCSRHFQNMFLLMLLTKLSIIQK